MLSKSRFCRRINAISELVYDIFHQLGNLLKEISIYTEYIIDSFPVSICHNIRIARCRIARSEDFRGYITPKREYFFGVIDLPNKGYTVEARNCRTNEVMKGSISNGYFSLACADLNRNSVIQSGDILEITVNAPNGNIVSNTTYTVNNDNINKAYIYVPLKLGNLKPSNTCLLQNYPNPFNPETWIPFQLAEKCNVKLQIYDIHGKIIRTFDLGNQPAGIYTTKDKAVYWDGRNEDGEIVSSGIYFYEIQAGNFSSIKKMIIQK